MSKLFTSDLTLSEIKEVFPELDILEIIKSGGEGTVIKTFLKDQDKFLALKIYAPDHLSKRNELEVKKLSKISSPYMIQLYNYGTKMIKGKECFYTLTSFINGNDLRRLMQSGYKFTEEEVINMIKCISSAITELWKEKVVHCDIKPDNILYVDGNFILIDLGIAKYIDEPTMTAYGVIMGTLGYIAPEQIKGRKNLTQKADYYSLGIVAYEMLVGNHPFNFNQDLIMELTPLPEINFSTSSNSNLTNTIKLLTQPLAYKRPFNQTQILKCLGVI